MVSWKWSDDEEEIGEVKHKKSWFEYVVDFAPFVIGILLIIFFRGRWGFTPQYDRATFYVVMGWLGYIFMRSAYLAFESGSPKIIFNPSFSTTSGNFDIVGNYAVIPMGGIYKFGIHYRGRKGTAVIPLSGVTRFGRSIALTPRLEEVEAEELSPMVQTWIAERGYSPPFYYGWGSEAQEIKEPSMLKLKEENKALNVLNTFYVAVFEGRTDVVEKLVQKYGRIIERAKGSTLTKVLKKMGEKVE